MLVWTQNNVKSKAKLEVNQSVTVLVVDISGQEEPSST